VRAYNAFQAGLTADATSGTDTAAVAHLPVSVPSSQVLLTTAQARAAGLAAAATADGSIEFTSHAGISYATTRAALTSGSYDLIGVAEDAVGWDVVVAEPTSGAVMLAGLGVLAFWRRGELARIN